MSLTLKCHILSCSLRRQNSVSQSSVWAIFIFITYKINPSCLMSFVSHLISKAAPLRTALNPKCETHYHLPHLSFQNIHAAHKAFFFLDVPCAPPSVAACCPDQPVRARPGDFDSFIHSCALEHLPDIIGFCIP